MKAFAVMLPDGNIEIHADDETVTVSRQLARALVSDRKVIDDLRFLTLDRVTRKKNEDD